MNRKANLLDESIADVSRAAARAREAEEPELADALTQIGAIMARARAMACAEQDRTQPLATGPDVIRKG